MNLRSKYTVIVLFFCLITLPFALMRDIFPLFRFAMFAEPALKPNLIHFAVSYPDVDGKELFVTAEDLEISESNFHQIMQNHYYGQETDKFLEKMADAMDKKPEGFRFYTISLEHDTALIVALP